MRKRKLMIPVLALAILMITSLSCKKEPGDGGGATIKGKILVQDYNKVTHATIGNPYAAGKVDVFIIYGDGTTFNDKTETSYDGTYAFRFLRKGKYTVFMYSDIVPTPSTGSTKEAITFDVEVTDKKAEVNVPDATVKNYK